MEYWEFLLQQEGDQNWLPLDTAQVEILEGRYRIMAHTSQANLPVQIQISQQSLDQVPPKRRALKRQGQTNADGLMVVIPFTRLAAGTWDIYCSSQQPASDPAATEPDWAYAIQLQVMAQGSGDDEWFVDEGQMAAEDSAYSDAEYPQPDLGMASPWADLDFAQVSEAMNRVQSHLATGGTQAALYRVTLHQTALSGHEGESLGLQGQVTGVVEGESCSDMTLLVRLSDPQTAAAVAMQPFSLPASTLPASFNVALNIPDALSTRLLLGEVGLVLVSAGTVSLLALQRFTVTVNLASLFDAIANQAESETAFNLDFSSAESTDEPTDGGSEDHPSDPNAWANVSLPQGPPRAVPGLMLPRSGFTLPPKIYYPSPHEASAHRPTLPPLGSTKGRTVPAKGNEAAATAEPTATVPESSTGVEASPSTATPRESTVPPAPNRLSLSLPPLATFPTEGAADNEAVDSANLPAPTIAGTGAAPLRLVHRCCPPMRPPVFANLRLVSGFGLA
ncbi:MAG: hypothetical protein HC929_22205 [Leptolyngbyaceae cyanobacterium SM2_5_2]|nr:hypothetical protein [Leptolyngbyaceae cyanobacterium SM2_5_2]